METHQDRVPARRSWRADSDVHEGPAAWLGLFAVRRTHLLDQVTEWERRIQEYEVESFSDGMKIAVLAAPESIRNVVPLAAGPVNGKYWVVRQNMSEFLQSGRIFDKDGRGVESESNSAGTTPMDVEVVGKGMGKGQENCKGKGKGKGCFVCRRPGHAARDCKFNQAKGHDQSKGKGKSTTDKHNPPCSREFRHCGKKGHTWADCRKRLAEAKDKTVHAVGSAGAPSIATVAAVEDTGEIGEYCWPDDDSGTDTFETWGRQQHDR